MKTVLAILAAVTAAIYVAITILSQQFSLGSSGHDRPLMLVLLLLAIAFAVYVAAITVATRLKPDRKLFALIVGGGFVFRLILLFSIPIQEIDLYRYIWDGVVSQQGFSPFQYAPDQVESAAEAVGRDEAIDDPELRKLARYVNQNDAVASILRQIHYSELPTVYPPTSQSVFYMVAATTPSNASPITRVRLMKLWLIAFDVGVIFLVLRLLQMVRLPVGLSVAYAWCPLVLKEVANSGHLDSIAIFLTTLAVLLMVKLLDRTSDETQKSFNRLLLPSAIAIVLALAVGAKLYPIILAPVFLVTGIKRTGWRSSTMASVVFLLVTAVLLWPMRPRGDANNSTNENGPEVPGIVSLDAPESEAGRPESDPSRGITAFLKYWEMNDLIFMVIVENLKPEATFPKNNQVWFSVAPQPARTAVVSPVARWLNLSERETPFMITRALTTVMFLVIAIVLALRTTTEEVEGASNKFCEVCFLTIAWFWLLSPTQNPWYWLWAMPLLPFCRNRAWYAISGLALLYYLRFWFDYQLHDSEVLGTGYRGTRFFDLVIPWLEFGPWFLWLAIASLRRRGLGGPKSNQEGEL